MGKTRHALVESDGFQRTPQWSPDGKQIAFSMYVPKFRTDNVFVVNADGTGLKNLIDTRRFAADPAWSPDSSRIAFVAAIVGRPGRLTVMNIDGTNQTDVLGHDLHVAVYPAWTADGKQLTVRCARRQPQGPGDANELGWDRNHRIDPWAART